MARNNFFGIDLGEDSAPGESQVVAQLRQHFDNQRPRFRFNGVIGRGSYGVTCQLVEDLGNGISRRLALKRALNKEAVPDLRNEIRWLKRLRGAEHIARMVADNDQWFNIPGTRRLRHRIARRFRTPTEMSLVGIRGPVMVSEYLENGTLTGLYYRMNRHGNLSLPNRVLWAFWLCMLRASVGMAYPMRGEPEQPSKLEVIPDDGREPSFIDHGDLHMGNMMIGDNGGPFPEHSLVPELKFIDFGMAAEMWPGAVRNLFRSCLTMMVFITGQAGPDMRWRTMYNTFMTMATEILPHGNGVRYPALDPDLRDLLAVCLACEPEARPELAYCLGSAEFGAARPPEEYAPYHHRESDANVSRILSLLIYDADTNTSEPNSDNNLTVIAPWMGG